MSYENVVTKAVTAGGQTISKRLSFTAGGRISVDESIPGSTTNLQLMSFAIDVSALKQIYIVADTALSLFFNDASTGSPSKTIVLVANEPFEWDNASNITNPWGATDVTALYVTKAGAGASHLIIEGLQDITP